MAKYICAEHGGWLYRQDHYRCARCHDEGRRTKRKQVGRPIRTGLRLRMPTLRSVVIILLTSAVVVFFKGRAIERSLRESGWETSAEAVHAVNGYLHGQKRAVKRKVRRAANQKAREVKGAAERMVNNVTR